MNITKTKNYPDNSHMDYYKDWEYLGSDSSNDYYYKSNIDGVIIGGDHLLSIVYGVNPWDYLSPDINYLMIIPSYKTMKKLLINKGII